MQFVHLTFHSPLFSNSSFILPVNCLPLMNIPQFNKPFPIAKKQNVGTFITTCYVAFENMVQ